MEAREFRIGNYLEYFIQDNLDKRKEWWEMSKIDATDISLIESGVDENYRPIRITEEILLRLGFKKYIDSENVEDSEKMFGDYGFFSENTRTKIQVIISNESVFTLVQFNIGMGYNLLVSNPPEYVHELQNLYFALTGQELTLQP